MFSNDEISPAEYHDHETAHPIQWAILNADPHQAREVLDAFYSVVGLRMHYLKLPPCQASEAEYFDADLYVKAMRRAANAVGGSLTADQTCEVLLKHFARREEALHLMVTN